MTFRGYSIDTAWATTINEILDHGEAIAPRGKPTLEIPHHRVVIDARRPVLRNPARKLSYQFMAAEAYWILSGDDRVETIAPYNPNIAQFSDDGRTFFGAYGPKIEAQLPYVVRTLIADGDTRQAGLSIWREAPGPTKDVPCTLAIFFQLRGALLRTHVYMRSSDVWLGLPYDLFTFSMLAHLVAAKLRSVYPTVEPGPLYLTAASSHLYETDRAGALAALDAVGVPPCPPTPDDLLDLGGAALLDVLARLRETKRGNPLRWWEW